MRRMEDHPMINSPNLWKDLIERTIHGVINMISMVKLNQHPMRLGKRCYSDSSKLNRDLTNNKVKNLGKKKLRKNLQLFVNK